MCVCVCACVTQIVNYDARKITKEMRAKVEKLLASKGNSFEQQVSTRCRHI